MTRLGGKEIEKRSQKEREKRSLKPEEEFQTNRWNNQHHRNTEYQNLVSVPQSRSVLLGAASLYLFKGVWFGSATHQTTYRQGAKLLQF